MPAGSFNVLLPPCSTTPRPHCVGGRWWAGHQHAGRAGQGYCPSGSVRPNRTAGALPLPLRPCSLLRRRACSCLAPLQAQDAPSYGILLRVLERLILSLMTLHLTLLPGPQCGSSGEVVGIDVRDGAIRLTASNLTRLKEENME